MIEGSIIILFVILAIFVVVQYTVLIRRIQQQAQEIEGLKETVAESNAMNWGLEETISIMEKKMSKMHMRQSSIPMD